MHKYATDVLHLSDAEAYLRITAARASHRYPVLLTMLEEGRLHLSGIAVLASHLDKLSSKDRECLLARATHKSKRDIQELVTIRTGAPPTESVSRHRRSIHSFRTGA